ncbi:hypothetical protein ID866_10645 [Astraeus odoratus]|nr:hypothetical protein ID866_10645 [Astraeus odoratus]
MSAVDDTKLMEVAEVYLHGFIRAFKWRRGPTPALSKHPSSPSFEDARAYSMELMQEGKLDHRKARDAALHRDNYCCMITGKLNIPQGGSTYIEAAHIIPEATNTKLKITIQGFHSASVWAVLSMFTDLDIIVDLAGNKIHHLENIITMNQHCHHLFDDLYLWLKPTEGPPHTYCVHLAREEWRKDEGIPKFITLTMTTDLPLLNGAYFALHALCCEVAWMLGAGEYIMDIERRMEDERILENDGSNADLLASALAFVAVH